MKGYLRFKCIILLIFNTFICLNANAQKESADVKYDEDMYDFGNIIMENGPVTHKFYFTNIGLKPLKVIRAEASCGCTAADFTKDSIMPGKKGYVKVTFDPKGKLGENSKYVTVITNTDPAIFNLIIKSNVVPKNNRTRLYKYYYGNVVVINNNINLKKTHPLDTTVFEIPMYNNGNKIISVKKINKANNIMIGPYIKEFGPDEELVLRCAYTPIKPTYYGPQRHEIRLFTDDDSMPIKSFYIESEVFDNPKNFTKKELKRSPKGIWNKKEVDFGNVYDTSKLTAEFVLKNKGKDPLIIRRIIKPCECIHVTSQRDTLMKNESTVIKITYTPEFYVGVDERFIRIITNEILKQEEILTLKSYVVPAR